MAMIITVRKIDRIPSQRMGKEYWSNKTAGAPPLFVVSINGRRIDSFLKKSNANRLVKKIKTPAGMGTNGG